MFGGSYFFRIKSLLGSSSRLSLRVRRHEKCFRGNALGARPNFSVQLSTIPGLHAFLLLNDPWIRWKSYVLTPSSDDEGSLQPASVRGWVTTSPNSLAPSLMESILHGMKRWMQKWWRRLCNFSFVTVRTSEVLFRLSPLVILTPAAYIATYILDFPMISRLAWSYSITAIQGLGPVAVKFCQWAATRRDIFSPTLCDQLSILHDSGYPHPRRWTNRVLTESFGDYERKGLVIGTLIGCGSAAQVYKGVLTKTTDSGHQSTREVAIKVLHPSFQDIVDRDLDLISIVAEFLHSLPIDHIKMLNLPRAVEEFSVSLRDQADLTIEAQNLRVFRKNFYKDSEQIEDRSSIVFPKPMDGWISSNVIVEDFIGDAVPIADFLLDSSEDGMEKRKDLAGPLLRAFLKMVFVDNFIHGDLHPGNVLVRTKVEPKIPSKWNYLRELIGVESLDEKSTKTKMSIVFLDAGIGISLSENDQRNLIDLFRAVIFNDGNRAGRLMVERAKYERCTQTPGGVSMFSEGIGEIVSEFHDRRKEGLTLGAVRIGVLLRRVLDLCRIHGVEIDPAMASVVISTLVLEGLGRSLSPDLDLLTFARPFLMPTHHF